MRSKLFVPGSRPELFDKAFASEADAISIDLEDAVVESQKPQARATVGAWLQTRVHEQTIKTVIVRVNAMDTPYFLSDIEAVVQAGLNIVNLPKPASVDAVREACAAIAAAERRNNIPQAIRVLLNIETPHALRIATQLAQADPRVMGLQVGLGDLFEPLGIERRDVAAVQQVLFTVRMAAGEAGIEAFDGAFANIQDTDGYLAEAQMARRLGFSGKSCIHPSQIVLANQAFRPTDADIAYALKVIAAVHAAGNQDLGAFLVDDRMIDLPFIRRAETIIAQAQQLRLLATI
ncbi:MAG: CoA ester lyase [Burkholderiaceae bacterium]